MHVHGTATTTPRVRRELCQMVDRRVPVAEAARAAGCSRTTAYKWLARWRAGDRELLDRSSRPHRMPRLMSPFRVLEIIRARTLVRIGAHRLSRVVGIAGSSIAKALKRWGAHRLHPPAERRQIVRYEYARPGAMLHIDSKKLGRIARVGHRITGDRQRDNTRGVGWEAMHIAIDDCTRLAYAEILSDETYASAEAFLERAVAWYAAHGITIERVLTDNGAAYKRRWRELLAEHSITPRYTRPYRPQTNGKAERFIRTTLNECVYGIAYPTSDARRSGLAGWQHSYNHHRPHSALANLTPTERLDQLLGVNNLCGLHI